MLYSSRKELLWGYLVGCPVPTALAVPTQLCLLEVHCSPVSAVVLCSLPNSPLPQKCYGKGKHFTGICLG